jgi:hypothetical protein
MFCPPKTTNKDDEWVGDLDQWKTNLVSKIYCNNINQWF